MDTLARQIGETLVAQSTAAAVARWGVWRVAGWCAVAAIGLYLLSAHKREGGGAPALAAPDADALRNGRLLEWPEVDRRRAHDVDQPTYTGVERRTLH